MLRIIKWVSYLLLILIPSFLAFLSLFSHGDLARYNEKISLITRRVLGREINIEGPFTLDWRIFSAPMNPRFHVENITIPTAKWDRSGTPLVKLKKIDLTINLIPLLKGQIQMDHLEIDGLTLNLVQNVKSFGNWKFYGESNYEDEEGSDEIFSVPVIKELKVTNVFIHSLSEKEGSVDLNARILFLNGGAPSIQEPYSFKLGGDLQGETVQAEMKAGAVGTMRPGGHYPANLRVSGLGATFAMDTDIKFSEPPRIDTANFIFKMTGASLSNTLAKLKFRTAAPVPRFQFAGAGVYEQGTIKVDTFNNWIGLSHQTGILRYHLPPHASLVADFDVQELYYRDIIGLAPASNRQTVKSLVGPRKDERTERPPIFSDRPLNWAFMRRLAGNFKIRISKIIGDTHFLTKASMAATLRKGIFELSDATLQFSIGSARFSGTIDARERERLQTKFKMQFLNLELNTLIKDHAEHEARGLLSGLAHFASYGNSLHQLAARAKGRLDFIVENGHISDVMVETFGIDVAHSIAAWMEGDQSSPLNCGIVTLDLDKGRATLTDGLLIGRDTDITSQGWVDFGREETDLTLRAHSKKISYSAYRAPIQISGRPGEFRIGRKPKEASSEKPMNVIMAGLYASAVTLLPMIDPSQAHLGECSKMYDDIKNAKKDLGP